jgi:thymidylate synthase (FAD)
VPAELRVDVIAETMADPDAMLHATDGRWLEKEDGGEQVAVFAGRACYQSWSKPNPATATTKGYLAHIIEAEHFNVMRHAVVTIYIQGISRSCSHELIRHHVGIDFSQLSQRYVDTSEMDYVIPPASRGSAEAEDRLEQHWRASVRAYEAEVARLLAEGKTRKQAREAARAFLPNCTETKIVVTANLQAWRNFIAQRATEHADAEIRELAVQVAWEMKKGFPAAFQDMHLLVNGETGLETIYFGPPQD